MTERPYTVATLADRWACSEAHVRGLIRQGKLRSFCIGGKLIRIAAEEVEKWEKSQDLSGTGGSSPSVSSKMDNDSAARLARMTSPSVERDLQSSIVFGRFKQPVDP